MNPLAIVPIFLREPHEVSVLDDCLRTLRGTAGGDVDIIVVDDGSPERQLVDEVAEAIPRWQFELHRKLENTGFSKTVNVGLARALEEGRDAILVNADIEFRQPGWVDLMVNQPNLFHDGPAWVVGALLSYPNGLIQHAGVFFSMLTRSFDHLWKYAPENLPEALAYRCCPVTGALQLIRHEALASVGLYDESFSMGYEDVDFCLRVFMAQQECVFHPGVRAWHHESLFRGRPSPKIAEWQKQSWWRLAEKYKHVNFASLAPAA